MTEMKLQYQGFHPSQFMQSYLEQVLSKMLSEAPRKSVLSAHFSRHEKSFKAFVQIFSRGKVVFASAEGNRIKHVVKLIQIQLKKRILKNKKNRFSREGLFDLVQEPLTENRLESTDHEVILQI